LNFIKDISKINLLRKFLKQTLVRVAREHVLKRIENHEFSKVIFGSNLANTEELEAHGYTVEEPVPGLKPAEA